jgi:hypothetical protein
MPANQTAFPSRASLTKAIAPLVKRGGERGRASISGKRP